MKTLPQLVLRIVSACLLISPVAHADDEAAIKKIRALYAKIDGGKATSSKKIAFNLEADPMEGTITRHTYKGGLTSITLSYIAGDHGSSDEHYYYDEKGVFFIFAKDSVWRFGPGGTPENPGTIDTLTEKRYYIEDGACIRALAKSVSSADAKELPALISKAENKKTEPGDQAGFLVRRAKALPDITTGKEAASYFSAER